MGCAASYLDADVAKPKAKAKAITTATTTETLVAMVPLYKYIVFLPPSVFTSYKDTDDYRILSQLHGFHIKHQEAMAKLKKAPKSRLCDNDVAALDAEIFLENAKTHTDTYMENLGIRHEVHTFLTTTKRFMCPYTMTLVYTTPGTYTVPRNMCMDAIVGLTALDTSVEISISSKVGDIVPSRTLQEGERFMFGDTYSITKSRDLIYENMIPLMVIHPNSIHITVSKPCKIQYYCLMVNVHIYPQTRDLFALSEKCMFTIENANANDTNTKSVHYLNDMNIQEKEIHSDTKPLFGDKYVVKPIVTAKTIHNYVAM